MNQEELVKLRTVTEIARRTRRENDRLREALGQYTKAEQKFDRENVELFAVVHKNHRRNENVQ